MIDLYYAATPNGHKVTMFLEETGMPYRVIPVNLGKGEQFTPEFLAIAPNNKIPAIVDHNPQGGGSPVPLFESGAILLYLAEKTGRFIPASHSGRAEVLKWLFWQVGGLGPMAGQIGHFNVYAPEKVSYAIERYTRETNRLYGVLDRRLADRDFVAGEYSIADMACYPWIVPHRAHGQDLEDFVHLKRWFETIAARPATARAYGGAADVYANPGQPIPEMGPGRCCSAKRRPRFGAEPGVRRTAPGARHHFRLSRAYAPCESDVTSSGSAPGLRVSERKIRPELHSMLTSRGSPCL